MKLKCIGGDCDGKLGDAPEVTRKGDFIKVVCPSDYKISIRSTVINEPAIEAPPIGYRLYQVIEFVFFENEIREATRFLIPADWTPNKAIKFMVEKHNAS